MSTVDKVTADKVAKGGYPEDKWTHIIRYENTFNGNFAYKLCRSVEQYQSYMRGTANMDNPTLYWSKAGGYANASK